MLIIGIDDAGRGPLLGPMILAGVLIEHENESELKKLGAKDSKLLSHPERVRLASVIRKEVLSSVCIHATPTEIDEAVLGGENLNTLEARKMAEVINTLNDPKKDITVIVDCPSINIKVWREKLISFIKHPQNLTVLCEHKADANHPSVSAASILAKVEREEEVQKLKEMYGNIGSGYPADPITKAFLQEHGSRIRETGIVRKSWATWQELFPEDRVEKKKQKKLTDF